MIPMQKRRVNQLNDFETKQPWASICSWLAINKRRWSCECRLFLCSKLHYYTFEYVERSMIFHKIVPGKCVWQFHICGFFFSEGVVRVGWSRANSRACIDLFVFFWRGLPTKKVTSITSYSYCTVDYICLCYLVTAMLWMLPIPARLQRGSQSVLQLTLPPIHEQDGEVLKVGENQPGCIVLPTVHLGIMLPTVHLAWS